MPQHDMILANQAGAAFRADLNDALAALVANNSGATEPATMYAYMLWADTTTGLLKVRNAANSAWITVGTLASVGLGLLSRAGGSMTGLLTLAASTDIASAATVDLSTATGNTTRITGTTATSAFTMTAGQWHMCVADGAWPLTYHATTNKLNTGGSNYTCAAGDRVLLHKDNSGIIQATIFPTSGKAVVGTTTLTPIATTSGSAQTHSSLPAGIKKVSAAINGVSSNGTAVIGIQLGYSGGLKTSGYGGCVNNFNGTALASLSTSFALSTSGAAAQVLEGVMDLVLVDSSTNTWNATWIMSRSDGTTGVYTGSGSVSLSGTLDRVAIVTSDTLDAGKFGLTYTV